MDDSSRNIMAGLRHEADEPCHFCSDPMSPKPTTSDPMGPWGFEDYFDNDQEIPCHTECLEAAYEDWREAQAERRADARAADSEARFNRRWPI